MLIIFISHIIFIMLYNVNVILKLPFKAGKNWTLGMKRIRLGKKAENEIYKT